MTDEVREEEQNTEAVSSHFDVNLAGAKASTFTIGR